MAQEPLEVAYLIIQQGPRSGKRIELCKDYTSIGRSRYCDIFLEDIAVHRKQASILWNNTGFLLRDESGSGDSFVNGQPVQEKHLTHGDLLLFGNTELIFYAHEATQQFQQPSSRGRELYLGKKLEPQASTSAKIDLIGMGGLVQSFELQPPMTIGRSRDCSIFLEDLAVSRLHVNIRQLSDTTYELEDHRSATGTFVNGLRVKRCLLNDGDVLQIGSNKLVVHLPRS
ncbi:MAG: FHA domain-containing protein [Ktedonobacteraceae bacterium]